MPPLQRQISLQPLIRDRKLAQQSVWFATVILLWPALDADDEHLSTADIQFRVLPFRWPAVTMSATLMNTTKIVADLRTERGRIDRAISAIENINSSGRRRGRPVSTTGAPKHRRKGMSAAARTKLSRLLKQRWAQGKMKTRTKPVRASNLARHMSKAARRKIAAAQRARWAKVKAQQKAQTKAA